LAIVTGVIASDAVPVAVAMLVIYLLVYLIFTTDTPSRQRFQE
jgi:hypothetical protein